MNNRIIRIGLAAVAVAAIVVIGIVLLAGRGTGAQLTPSSAQAQSPGLASPVALAKAGGLDTSFGGDGKVVTNLTRWDDRASALAIQADGKIVLAGGAGSDGRFGVARYSSEGTLDTSFSGDGRALVHFTWEWNSATGVAIQADGKIVVVGWEAESRGSFRFALARLNTDGTLDASFGGDGKVTTRFTTAGGWDKPSGVVIQADGRIVVVGTAGRTKFALARYNSDGTLDRTFGVNGKVRTDFTSGFDSAYRGRHPGGRQDRRCRPSGVLLPAKGHEVRPRPLQQRRHPRRDLRRRRQGDDQVQLGIRVRHRGGHPGGRQDRRRRHGRA